MAYEPKEGSGAIFKNEKKSEDKHPDYRGTFKGLDGKMYNGALWVKEDKNGKKFFSFRQSEYKERDNSMEDLPF